MGPILTIFWAKKDDFDSKLVGNTVQKSRLESTISLQRNLGLEFGLVANHFDVLPSAANIYKLDLKSLGLIVPSFLSLSF